MGLLFDVYTAQLNGAFIGLDEAGNGPHGGALTCAVGTDKADKLTGLDGEIEALERVEFAVLFVHAAKGEDGVRHGLFPEPWGG